MYRYKTSGELRKEIQTIIRLKTTNRAAEIITKMIIEAGREKPSKEISKTALARGTAEEVGA